MQWSCHESSARSASTSSRLVQNCWPTSSSSGSIAHGAARKVSAGTGQTDAPPPGRQSLDARLAARQSSDRAPFGVAKGSSSRWSGGTSTGTTTWSCSPLFDARGSRTDEVWARAKGAHDGAARGSAPMHEAPSREAGVLPGGQETVFTLAAARAALGCVQEGRVARDPRTTSGTRSRLSSSRRASRFGRCRTGWATARLR
jgi:hypothetical protein